MFCCLFELNFQSRKFFIGRGQKADRLWKLLRGARRTLNRDLGSRTGRRCLLRSAQGNVLTLLNQGLTFQGEQQENQIFKVYLIKIEIDVVLDPVLIKVI
jgi:hypothetical protein